MSTHETLLRLYAIVLVYLAKGINIMQQALLRHSRRVCDRYTVMRQERAR